MGRSVISASIIVPAPFFFRIACSSSFLWPASSRGGRSAKDAKERERFLSHYHGEYSGASGGNDDLSYTYKRLYFAHGIITHPYATVELSWSKVLKRIENLLRSGKFLSDADREAMADYEIGL